MVKRGNILRNSFWYGIEAGADLVFGALTSIAIARVMGPERLGYYVYLVFLTNIAGKLGGLGTAAAGRKYIAEYLNRQEAGLVRAVFFVALRTQIILAAIITLVGVGVALTLADPAHRLTACLLVTAIAPLLISSIPALANVAAEDFARNVPGALLGLLTYTVTVALTLVLDWGLVGLAAAVLLRRLVEMAVRLRPALHWMRTLPKIPTPEGLHRKIFTFSGQALAINVLMIVVWDRSELVFLKQFSSISQLAFYTVAFGLTEQILMLANIFGGAVGAALMADYARNVESAGRRAATAVRYLCLFVFPIHMGLAALSAAAIRLAYGPAYLPAIPVLSIVLVLGIFKAFSWLPWAIYQAADRQATMFRWLLLAAAVNLGLDAALIPPFGAIGAAFANGLSQAFAVVTMWPAAARLCRYRAPWGNLMSTALAAGAMGLMVAGLVMLLPPLPAVLSGVPVGCLLYGVLLRLTRVISFEDAQTLSEMVGRLPAFVHRPAWRVIQWLSVPKPAALNERTADTTL
jgi:O-antigen/teichoic acid export membrane protein